MSENNHEAQQEEMEMTLSAEAGTDAAGAREEVCAAKKSRSGKASSDRAAQHRKTKKETAAEPETEPEETDGPDFSGEGGDEAAGTMGLHEAEEFQSRLEKLIASAAQNGNIIDKNVVADAFADLMLEDEKYDLITTYIESKGIDIVDQQGDPEPDEDIDDAESADYDDSPNNAELEIIEQQELEQASGTESDDDLAGDAINIEDPVRMYLKEIGKVPLLTAEEEVAIAKRMENGDIAKSILETVFSDVADDDTERVTTQEEFMNALVLDEQKAEADEKAPVLLGKTKAELKEVVEDGEEARKKLAEANLRLVVSIAKRYVGRGMLFLDLIQEGNLGLIKAVEKFDFRKGFKFSTYATWWIRQAITRAIADQARTIRIPVHMVETINKLVRISRQLLQELGREPTPEEIAVRMDIPVERVREIIKISQEPVSLETPIGEEEDSHLGDFIQDENVPVPADAAAYTLLKEQLQEVLGTLTEREQKVLRLRFGLDDGRARTLEEVGREFNVTRERIRQIEAKALRKLRHPSRSRKLKDYLD